jgi:hypothetical protein
MQQFSPPPPPPPPPPLLLPLDAVAAAKQQQVLVHAALEIRVLNGEMSAATALRPAVVDR